MMNKSFENTFGIVLFILGLCVLLFPIWSCAIFLTQDGAAHIYTAHLLNVMLDGEWANSTIGEYFDPALHVWPNLLADVLLTPLVRFFDPVIAEKLFQSFLVLSFPFSVLFFVREHRYRMHIATLVLPLVYSWTLYKGFYNFYLSIPCCIVGIRCWYDYTRTYSMTWLIAAAVATWLTYTSHLIGVGILGVAALLIVSLHCFNQVLSSYKYPSKLVKHCIKNFGALAIVFFGPFLLSIAYFLGSGAHDQSAVLQPFDELIFAWLLGETLLMTESAYEQSIVDMIPEWFALLAFCGLVYSAIKSKIHSFDLGLCLLFAFVVFGFFLLEDQLGDGGFITVRLALYSYFILALLAARSIRTRWLAIVSSIMSLILTFALVATRKSTITSISKQANAALEIASKLEPYSTLYTMSFNKNVCDKSIDKTRDVKPFLHLGGYAAARNEDVVLIDHYHGLYRYFPIKWKTDKNPYHHLGYSGGIEGNPPELYFKNYEAKGSQVDYVLSICLDETIEDVRIQAAVKQLDEQYILIETASDEKSELLKKR